MTREEALRVCYLHNKKLIDKIFKEFEPRSCESCSIPNRNGYCKVIDSNPIKGFWCNKYEPKV